MIDEGCPPNHHLDIQLIDEEICLPIKELFDWLFTDSKFFRKFSKQKKTSEINLNDWEDDLEVKGQKVRKINYVVSLNMTFGPKTSPSKEIQTLLPESNPKSNFTIESRIFNTGVPYCDNFHTIIKYCLKVINDNKTKLNISCKVIITKNIMVTKMLVEKTAINGTKSNFTELVELLKAETEKPELPNSSFPREPINRRKERRTSIIRIIKPASNDMEECHHGNHQSDFVLKFVIITLFLVLLCNMCIYMQISSLETTISSYILATKNQLPQQPL